MKKNKIPNIRVNYAQTVYGKEEIKAVNDVLKNPLKIAQGPRVSEFQDKISRLFSKKYGVMVNSGSSANLLAVELLKLPKGSEVITPVLTFSTTIAPLIQKGLIPVFVDVTPGTYLIDIDQIESLITKKTRALMIPSLLGNVPDLKRLKKIAKKHKLWLIEDSCDTIGAKYDGVPTGHYTDISTTSFYASHIITTAGAGGMICVNDKNFYEKALVMASWGRQSTLFGSFEKSENIKKRFEGKIGGKTYDAKFIFSEVGYNFQSTEINAAFGLEQLKKLPLFSKIRKTNFSKLYRFFSGYEKYFILPVQDKKVQTNWLAFPLTVKEGAPFTRNDLTKYLEEHNIQTRPIFTGNILRQPGFSSFASKGNKKYPVTDFIMTNGFVIGCNQALKDVHLKYIMETLRNFFKQHA